MHITLYQALKSIKIDDEKAAAVVTAVEEHMAMKISDATKGLEAELRAIKWLLGFIGVLLTIVSFGPIIAKL
jgi:hypothetical protein